MAFLYILSEGARDELFYEIIAERVTGRAFEGTGEFRVRHGSNWKTVLSGGRLLLNRFRHWQEPQDIAIILAVDNDRCPNHPGASPYPRPLVGHDLDKQARYPEVRRMIAETLGEDRTKWPVDVALAMPVEMVESWVLHLCNPLRPTLPLFAEDIQASARLYYGAQPPPQLKDLCKAEAAALGMSLEEFFWHAAEQDLQAAAVVSPSLKMFLDELGQWQRVGAV